MKKIYAAADVGKKGAFVILYPDGTIMKKKFPLIGGKEYDIQGMVGLMKAIHEPMGGLFDQSVGVHVVIEDVHAIFGSSAGATFEFGFGKGLLIGICSALKIPYTLVQPKTWQKEMFQGVPELRKPSIVTKTGETRKGGLRTKEMALIAAKQIFPGLDCRHSTREQKQNEGIVDALLMAEYGRRKF